MDQPCAGVTEEHKQLLVWYRIALLQNSADGQMKKNRQKALLVVDVVLFRAISSFPSQSLIMANTNVHMTT